MSAALKREEPGFGAAAVTLADLAATIATIAAEYPSDANVQLAQQQVQALSGTQAPGPGVWVKGGAAAAIAGGAALLGGVTGFALGRPKKTRTKEKRR